MVGDTPPITPHIYLNSTNAPAEEPTFSGDTDSVFIMAQGLSLETTNTLGNLIAQWYAERLPHPHVLEMEKARIIMYV